MPNIIIDTPLEAVHTIEQDEEVAVIIKGVQYMMRCEVDGDNYILILTN